MYYDISSPEALSLLQQFHAGEIYTSEQGGTFEDFSVTDSFNADVYGEDFYLDAQSLGRHPKDDHIQSKTSLRQHDDDMAMAQAALCCG